MNYKALDLIPEAVLVVDEHYRLVFANKRARELYGEGPKTCYGLSHGSEKPCYEIDGYPCPVKNIKDFKLEKSGVIHIHKTKGGSRHFYVLAGYNPKEKVYTEIHIDFFELVHTLRLSGQRTEFLLSLGPVVFFQWKRAEGWPVEMVSQNVLELLGYSAEDFLSGRISYAELVHPEDVERVAQELKYHTESKSSNWIHKDYRVRRKDGEYIWVLGHTAPLLDEDNKVVGYYGYIVDITEKHEQEELFHILAESNPYAVVIYDFFDNKVIYVNANTSKVNGFSREELLSHPNPIELIHQKDRQKILENIKRRKEGYEDTTSYKVRIITKSGKIKWVKLSSTVAHYKGKKVLVITFEDISGDIRRERKLTLLATRDQLTGILNRHALIQNLEHLLAQAQRYRTTFSLIIFDIDNFKSINDNYGHLVGDKVLKDVVRTAKKNIRKSDIFGRWGGEEFIMIFPMTSDPYTPAEKIRRALEEYGLQSKRNVTASFGGTVYREGDTIDDIIARADIALYQAKAEGKNKVIVL
ncbi:MAG: diguanylate cyclase [Aquificaceae bacterium]|nr:diguanylate cyclase [Aquificaceae bacterium]